MIAHPIPSRPWEYIASDLLEFEGRDYLITTDYYSNFFEVDRLYSKTSREVVNKLKAHMARHGIPDKLMSDNGPQYNSDEFRRFADLYEFEHVTSSPGYPQSNGKAENAVGTVQSIMQKALEAGTDPYLAFLDFRNTPSEGMDTSPSQRLFGRRTKTLLPTSSRLLRPKAATSTLQQLQANKAKQAYYYNRHTKSLKPLEEGDTVRIKPHKREKKWRKATVRNEVGTRSYQVTTENGRTYRRNRRHLFLTPEMASSPREPPNEVHIPEADQLSASIETTMPQVESAESPAALTLEPQPTVASPRHLQTPTRYSSRGRELRKPVYLKDYTC